MKKLLKSKRILTLLAFMVAGIISIPLTGSITYAHAQDTRPFSFTKTAAPTVAPGGTLTYTLTLKNTSDPSSLKLHDIHLTDGSVRTENRPSSVPPSCERLTITPMISGGVPHELPILPVSDYERTGLDPF